MKVMLGYNKRVVEEFDLPEKFEFLFNKNLDEQDYTNEQCNLEDEYFDWKYKVTGADIYWDTVEEIDII